MAINKNFVVKHGLEVDTNLVFADANTNKVGIKTSNPQYTLDVRGGIGVTDLYVSGIATIAVGVVTDLSGTNISYSGVGAISTLQSNIGILTSLNVSGIGTVLTELNVGTGGTVLTALNSGFVGVGTTNPGYSLHVIGPATGLGTALYVDGDVRITGDINVDDINFDDATVQNLNVQDTLIVGTSGGSGIATIGTLGVTGVTTTQHLQVTGITTLGSSNGIGTVTVGVGTTALYVDGNARVTGNLLIGSGTVTIDGNNNKITVGTGVSIDGNTGIISATSFVIGVTTYVSTLGVTSTTDLTTQKLNVSGVSTFTNGPVLIGSGTSTGTASQRLQVTGGAYVSGDVGIGTTNSGSADLAIVNTTNTAALSIGQNVDGTGENHLGLWYGGTRGTGGANVFTSNGNLRFDVDGAGGSGSQIEFGWGLNSNQTQMVVNSTAVGIGTTQPTSKLTVVGDAIITGVSTLGVTTATNLTSQQLNVSGVSTLGVTTSTNLTSQQLNVSGVSTLGVTSVTNLTSQQLNVSGVSTLGGVRITSGIITAASGIVTYYGDGSGLINTPPGFPAGGNNQIQYNSSSAFAGSSNLTFDGSNLVVSGVGSVGVGTTTPQYKLDVVGDINFTGTFRQNGSQFVASRWTSGTGNDVYILDGNIGIGTTNPTSKLTVQGDLFVNGVTTTTSTVVGSAVTINSSGINVSSGIITASRFTSNVSTGTAPISVASTTKVTNLNADLFDDQDSSYYTNASNISSGIVSTARLATSGTANSTTFLRGDQTWAVVDATKIINGTSEVSISSSNGNIAATVAGQNIFNVTGAGVSMVAGERLDVSSYSETVQTLGSSGSPISGTNSLNIGTYSTFIAYVGTSAVTFTLSGAVSGRLSSWTLILIYTNSGTRNVSYSFGTLRYPGGSSSVTLSNTQVHDILSFFTADGATNTYASVVGLGFAI